MRHAQPTPDRERSRWWPAVCVQRGVHQKDERDTMPSQRFGTSSRAGTRGQEEVWH
jgi:hypothetical protein